MCRFLDNDVFLGTMILKFLEKDERSIKFNRIYDFVFYASVKLNEDENTVILASREGIFDFVEHYNDLIRISENEDEIIVSNKTESVRLFRNFYGNSVEKYADAFEYAYQKVAA